MLEDLCGLINVRAEYNACRAAVPAAETADIWARPAGHRVGIYSLERPSLPRAAALIRRFCPECDVVLNHDRVSTELLRDMARSSYIVVMLVRVAQHAATDGIQRERGDRPTLRPQK